MNASYKGSVAERLVRFRSGLLATSSARIDLFNSVVIYVPSFLATDNIVDYDGTGLTEDAPIIKVITLDNYMSTLKGALLAQYAPVFNDGTNVDIIIYVVVFSATSASDVKTSIGTNTTNTSIEYPALTKAFNETYFIGFFKTLFSEHYNGTSSIVVDEEYDDTAFFDLALCLAYLCQYETTLSYFINMVQLDQPIESPDVNVCKALSMDIGAQKVLCTSLKVVIPSVTNPRDAYFFGMLNFMGCDNTWSIVHSENVNLIPVILSKWFQVGKNGSGSFVGNKLAHIRLSGNNIKATGYPSLLNADVNANMPLVIAERLDEMNVSYLMTISDASPNDCELSKAVGTQGFPVGAIMIAKYIDYNASQDASDWKSSFETGTNPILRNEASYEKLKLFPLNYLQKFVNAPSRLQNLELTFPAYSELPKSKTDFTVTNTWKAEYVDDLVSVFISGAIIY